MNTTETREWKDVVLKLKLREETPSGFDEQAYLLNYIRTLLNEERGGLREKIEGMKYKDVGNDPELSNYNTALNDVLSLLSTDNNKNI